jgi:hypothetical protein
MKGKLIIALSTLTCFAVIGSIAYYRSIGKTHPGENPKQTVAALPDTPAEAGMTGDVDASAIQFPGVKTKNDFIQAAVARLRQDYEGKTISKSQQARLMGLYQYLRTSFPASYRSDFNEIMMQAFPSQAGEIVKTLSRLEEYNAWLEGKRPELGQMTYENITRLLWSKRNELFGNDAKDMWAEETRTEAVKDILDIIRESYDTTMTDKLKLYVAAVSNISGDNGTSFIDDKKSSLTRAFVSLDSVQTELSNMDDAKRAECLRSIRKAMGYNDLELDAMAQKDSANEENWQTGYSYMQERNDIFHESDGENRSLKLAELQQRYFGNAAKTIQAEEASGFFRFDRPRVYGRN